MDSDKWGSPQPSILEKTSKTKLQGFSKFPNLNHMKIALIGYGKMGKIIEQVAISRGHQISLKIDLENIDAFNKDNLSAVDVAI